MAEKSAELYRMVMPGQVCPYGVKSLELLQDHGYTVKDRHLTSREEVDAFKEKQGVLTTPQTFVDGRRVGGLTELREFLQPAS